MSDLLDKCAVCHALLDEEDLFCANCGTEAPDRDAAAAPAARMSHHNFTCSGCGASMSYDASEQALRCPFCGSIKLEHQPDAKVLAAEALVPFEINQAQAINQLRVSLGQGFWRPSDLSQQALVETMAAVYVPYWIFQARTHTYWTADSSHTPPGARASWYPLFGEHRGSYESILVAASGVLTPSESQQLAPFNLQQALPPDQVTLENTIDERFAMPRKYARPLAVSALEEQERRACSQYVPGSARNVHVNMRLSHLTSRPLLLPVWVAAYRYRDQVYRFLINGQTGRTVAQAPLSYTKIAVAVAIAILVALFILVLLALSS